MRLNFIIENSRITLAKVFSDFVHPSGMLDRSAALTADGRLLGNDEFYILPSDEAELRGRLAIIARGGEEPRIPRSVAEPFIRADSGSEPGEAS